jgi:phage/plasmid-associated DNA primase
MYSNNTSNPASKPLEVSKENPCPHCGKPDWCYSIGELSVCNRDQPPATGWEATSKADKDGHFYYAPVQKKKPIRPAQTRYWEYPDRNGSPLVRVRRIDNGKNHKKDIKQQHWDKDKNDWVMGLGDVQRASIPIYRYGDVQKAITNGDYIFIVDGEQCADAFWALGLVATTCIGGAGKWRITDTSDLQGAKVVICPDRDSPGVEDAAKISQHFPEAQWLYCYPDSWAWDNLPKSQGLDVKDWIDDKKLSAQDILNSLTPRPRTCESVVRLSSVSSINDNIPGSAPMAESNFVLKAEEALYSEGHWASIAGQIYRFTGSYYELCPEVVEKRRIRDYLSNYSESVRGTHRKKYASSASINQVYDWVVAGIAVDPNTVNPDGLNCSNGVVKVKPDGSWELQPHNPKNIYTYVGCKFDPNISPADCDRLLECLEPSQREIFLRTAAAALNLKLVRSKLTGRGVKGLLCYGEGSNGKDTLRAVLATVFGRGMTAKSLSDFKSYDTGRKFNLSGLVGGICNWASENTSKVDLDNIQSLKQFITGDPIDIEPKGKDSYEYKPVAIFLANCNKLPSITGGTAAIDDRYGILRFDKTYARNAIAAEGQLEADPRFKDDEKFILEQVAPAILNKLLERWPLLLSEGIDYKATREAMQKAQEESRHLWQFVRDLGYEVGKGERVYAKDIWGELQEWYQETGILEIEWCEKGKEKLVWNDLPNQWDKPVKAINQLYARLCEIFPKLEKHRHTERGFEAQRTIGGFYYLGITKQKSKTSSKTASASSAVDTATILPSAVLQQEIAAEPLLKQTILTQRAAEDAEALNPTILELCNAIEKLTLSDRQKLTELLTGVPCSDPLKAFRVGDTVAGNRSEDASYNWHGRIVEINTSISCKVDWQEREGMRGGRVISMLFCNLRKI